MVKVNGFIAIGFMVLMGSGCSNLASELVARGLCHSQTGSQSNSEKSECRKLVNKEIKDNVKAGKLAKEDES
ncbi:hypothetical protein EKG38_09815 [Shewanella canadensis]|uniref:Lipoprotein n=1 Tax=Shewanella canadensis TaxID=271096 RepID=A0A3S0IPR1_9GAMM|nr:hypothetical protein [Shewanella canadensis]RTR39207.1 hypothetical protein EKG38_09815 [Shewanella canadensis]